MFSHGCTQRIENCQLPGRPVVCAVDVQYEVMLPDKQTSESVYHHCNSLKTIVLFTIQRGSKRDGLRSITTALMPDLFSSLSPSPMSQKESE